MSLLKRIERLEQIAGPKDVPLLFVGPSDDNKILGFRCGGSEIRRLPGESIKDLERRAIETIFNPAKPSLLIAICESWERPFNPPVDPDTWVKRARDYYKEANHES